MKQTQRPAEALHWQAELARDASLQCYGRGFRLLQQDTPVRDVYVLQSGLVKLVHTAANGHEFIVGLCTTGAWLGLAAASLQTTIPYSAVTLTPCELFRVPVPLYRNWLGADQAFALYQHELLSYEVDGQMQFIIDLVCASARQRLEQVFWLFAQTLWRNEAETRQNGTRSLWLQLPLQQQELASWIAVTPSHLSRLFKELEAAKLLRREKGWYVLPAPEKLWRARLPAHQVSAVNSYNSKEFHQLR